ncbi:MAG: MFS transporter [Pedobacter sp.]|nr:MAG: MFS transporter [Pedobacter sp.]
MRKPYNPKVATWLSLALLPLSGLATDIYIPSMPEMAKSFAVSNLQVQLTLGFFIISYGLTQLFVGSLLDSFGRYTLSLVGLTVFMFSNIIIAWSEAIEMIYLMRILQGISVAIVVVAKRAFFIDIYTGKQLANYLSLFTIIWSAGPIFAPFLGGLLEVELGWRGSFYFLFLYAAIIIALELRYSGETIRIRSQFNFRQIMLTYYSMIKAKDFLMGITMLCLAYSMIMIYNLTGAFILANQYHQDPIAIGNCSLLMGVAWLTGGLIGRVTVHHPFFKKMTVNILLQFALALAMVAGIKVGGNMYLVIGFAFAIHAAAGYTYNNYFGRCLSRFPEHAGTSGGLTGGIVNMVMFSITYLLVAHLPAASSQYLSQAYLMLTTFSLLVMVYVLKLNRSTASQGT